MIVRWAVTSKGPRDPRGNMWQGSRRQDDSSQLSYYGCHVALQYQPRPTYHQFIKGGYFHPVPGPEVHVSWWEHQYDSRGPENRSRILSKFPAMRNGRARPCSFPLGALDIDIYCYGYRLGTNNEILMPAEDLVGVKIGISPY